ncbi:hypothetical protein OsJ_19449 [Oryza sativa Japonica Group]|uniref:AP2/ERF domain-containing protein n=1 Tax=Oryza sativa subsp. japonica TaxID=39947 RepID=B9FLH0_ORYSJ|nr:hypothetical protein OsJ_19449 [Oryza sativa Japonica Group]
MDSTSCLLDDASSGASTGKKAAAAAASKALQRVGSGASAVMDAAEPGAEADSGGERRGGGGGKLPSSKYKGVVPQPNGRWGAQIYERHQRVWLGTFTGEAEAARALRRGGAAGSRGRDAVTNFRPLAESDPEAAVELRFLASRSKAEVVDMLRKHTYLEELTQNKRAFAAISPPPPKHPASSPTSSSAAREHLFDKTVTPSDVGKLNRLVIPKQHAEKHFPLQLPPPTTTSSVAAAADAAAGGGDCKGVLLNFEDAAGKVFIDCKVRAKPTTAAAAVALLSAVAAADEEIPAVKAIRLFGVDLLTAAAPELQDAGGEAMTKSKRAMDAMAESQAHVVFKKQCIELALT